MNYFEYKGIRSCDMGLRIESKEIFSMPEYEVDFLSIPGRDGDLISGSGRFPNVQVAYSVFLPAKSIAELSRKITAVKAWLYTDLHSYHTLADTYDQEFFRSAVYSGKLDIEDEMNRIGIFTISFSCKPFRFSTQGHTEVTVANGDALTNPYVFNSKPYLRITGSGSGDLTIQSGSNNASWHFTGIDGYVEADSEQMNFYKGAEPMNENVTGDGFPILYPGDNIITFTGGIQEVAVMPRWCSV